MATKRPFQDFHGLAQVQAYETTITGQGDLFWKNDVPTLAALPTEGNTIGDCRIVKEDGWTYKWIGTGWSKISNPIPHETFDDTMSDLSENAVMNKTIKSYVDTKDALKQDKLTAGANVQISQHNVISATDTTYTAGTNVSISNENVISAIDTTYSAGANISINGNNEISADVSAKVFSISNDGLKAAYQYYVAGGCPILLSEGGTLVFRYSRNLPGGQYKIVTFSGTPRMMSGSAIRVYELDVKYDVNTLDVVEYTGGVVQFNHSVIIANNAPGGATEGTVWYDTTNDVLKSYDGTNWKAYGTGNGDVTGPSSSTDGHIAVFDGTNGKVLKDGGALPTGDVTGPSSSTDGHVAVFDGITGKIVKDGGALPTGDVAGPVSSTDGHIAVFDGTDGKTIKDGGALPTGDIAYLDFEMATTVGATLTVTYLTTQITPASDFTITCGTVKQGMQYIVRVNSGATAYTMTLGTGVTNPYGETLTLTANKVTTLVFFATSSSTLELFGIKTEA